MVFSVDADYTPSGLAPTAVCADHPVIPGIPIQSWSVLLITSITLCPVRARLASFNRLFTFRRKDDEAEEL